MLNPRMVTVVVERDPKTQMILVTGRIQAAFGITLIDRYDLNREEQQARIIDATERVRMQLSEHVEQYVLHDGAMPERYQYEPRDPASEG